MPLKILWCSPYLMWPTSGGNKVRQFQLLRGLAERGHRVTLLVQSKVPLDNLTRVRLEPLVERLIFLQRRPRKHPVTLATALVAPYPVVVSVNGFSRKLRNTMSELLTESWDVVHVEHSYGLLSLLGPLEAARQPFSLGEHNVESSLTSITTYHPRIPRPFVSCLRKYDGWRYRMWEKTAIKAPTRVISVTQEDAAQLASLSGRSIDVVPNGVDTAALAHVRPDFGSRRLLFVGNHEYVPNARAVETTVTEILPLVWKRVPSTRFIVCGQGIRPEWRAKWRDPRIEWKGFVPDLAAEQSRSAMLLAPLTAGGGSKLKVLESMAAGLAVVGTPEAVSGLHVSDGREFREGRTSAELAARVIELLEDERALAELGDRARSFVRLSHDWHSVVGRLLDIFQEMTPASRVT